MGTGTQANRWTFAFDHRHPVAPRDLKDLLGGKGANLAEMMSVMKLPVPPGFTISTVACRAYMSDGWPAGLSDEIDDRVSDLERAMGRTFGDPDDPLLVSVRSGAKFSMPGMMDTVLDLGLTDANVGGLARVSGSEHFAWDSYRRFIAMYATTVRGVDGTRFRLPVDESTLDPEALRRLAGEYLAIYREATGEPFPQDPRQQLREAVEAVFRSWNGERARTYRTREGIPDDLGTAVNVQVMVYGNRDARSATGVGFTRNAATGEDRPYGDFLIDAQGEDVVAGKRTTLPLEAMRDTFPEIHGQLLDIFARLEAHYRDMCDVEFTIEQDKLWMLQTRIGKRTGPAALKMAVDMVAGAPDPDGGTWSISRAEAVTRITPDHVAGVLHSHLVDPPEALTRGLGASPGAAVGQVCLDPAEAQRLAADGGQVVLVRHETSPDDVGGMLASQGVLTARGGLVSHAAVVARGWGLPAVVGADGIEIDDDGLRVGDIEIRTGEWISLDGTTGEVFLGQIETRPASPPDELVTVLAWADDIRRDHLMVRANADTAHDAAVARELGAEGIGLCRTEHMFLGPDRLPVVQDMILAETESDESAALERLRVVQQADFEGVLEAMDGLPVTIRLLDPPLHEFLPDVEELRVREAAEGGLSAHDERLLHAAERWAEHNPMLGIRGVRLAVVKPGLYEMQVRAVLGAVRALRERGKDPRVQIMVPLTITSEEMRIARRWIETELAAAADEGLDVAGISIGTMIETPRAALRAGELAEVADFFSFGTNDLTQLTLGFSRDDVSARLIPAYLREHLLAHDPFASIDEAGVGELVRLAVERGTVTRPDIEIGVCGEHGGDPDSIRFFYGVGVDYVSCSPFRVPLARLAAAQAVINGQKGDR